jgi:hypothetical protein
MPKLKKHIGTVGLYHEDEMCRNKVFDTISELQEFIGFWAYEIYPAIRRGDKISLQVDFYQKPDYQMILEDGEWVRRKMPREPIPATVGNFKITTKRKINGSKNNLRRKKGGLLPNDTEVRNTQEGEEGRVGECHQEIPKTNKWVSQ